MHSSSASEERKRRLHVEVYAFRRFVETTHGSLLTAWRKLFDPDGILEIGYNGYVGQEFIPTRDPLAGLREAVALCDV